MRTSRREAVACGIDIGSTNVKVVAIDSGGAVCARASRPTPRDAQGLSIEGSELFHVVEDLIAEACADAYEAHALCTVGVGEDGLLLDADLSPVTTALAWFDPRRQEIFRLLRPQWDDGELYDAATDAARTMVGWAWARQLAGEEARTWVAIADLPAVLWTGRTFLSDSLASRTGAWRASSRAWASDRVATSLGSEELLPIVMSAGDVVGTISASSSLRAAGVVGRDAVVVVGGHDHSVGSWVADQLVPGAVLDSMGTAEVVVTQSRLPPSVRPNEVDIAPGIRSSGTTLLRVVELARNVSWAAQDPAVAHWIQALLDGTVRPDTEFDPGHFRPGHRGGGSPAYALDAPRDPRIKACAVLGALARAGRDSVNAVCSGAVNPQEVRLAGGWARSPGWVEIKRAVNGYSAEMIAEPEVTAVGAAFLGATARGWQPDPAEALGGNSVVQLP